MTKQSHNKDEYAAANKLLENFADEHRRYCEAIKSGEAPLSSGMKHRWQKRNELKQRILNMMLKEK